MNPDSAMILSGAGLAFRPFFQPLPLDDHWLVLLLPLVIAIAVVYKTIKLEDIAQLPRAVVSLTVQIVLFMVATASLLWLITELV